MVAFDCRGLEPIDFSPRVCCGSIFIFFCFIFIIIYLHKKEQRKIKIEPRIKLSYNIYYTKGLGECAEGWEWPREK